MSEPKKTMAVVGCGYWGKNLVRNFSELGALRAVCDLDHEALARMRDRFPVEYVTNSLDEVLTDDGVRGVALATPAALHHRHVAAALVHDKDVFVEKPLALSLDEGLRLTELAAERGRILMVGHILLYHPAVRKIKEIMHEGQLGRIRYVYSNRLNLGKIRTEENILWSFAPHDISVIVDLLGELPTRVTAQGASYINPDVADTTLSYLSFASGPSAHIYVSWLHPYKEHRLVIIGEQQMVVFSDTSPDKLVMYPHKIRWVDRRPTPVKAEGEAIPLPAEEPLKNECRHFLDCMASRRKPSTDGEHGANVLRVLQACQRSLDNDGQAVTVVQQQNEAKPYFIHPSSYIDQPAEIGTGTKIWHFSHVLKNSKIGVRCNIGQNVVIGPDVTIGNGCKIQNNVSVYPGVILEDNVFCGPSMVFTNVFNPRSEIVRKHEYRPTLVREGATLGANCTIVCGHTIGRYAFVAAGAVVTKDVPDFALVVGVPAKQTGWMCRCGVKLILENARATCAACERQYRETDGTLVEETQRGQAAAKEDCGL